MRLAIFILMAVLCASGKNVPGNSYRVNVTATKIGEQILSGAVTTSVITNKDSIYWQTNTASGGVLPIYQVLPPPLSWENLDPSDASFDGNIARVLQNGSVSLMLNYGYADSFYGYHLKFQVFEATAAGTNYLLQTNVVGSLSHHVSTNTYSRMTGTAATRRQMFTVRDSATTNFVRSTNFFLADVIGIESYIAGNNSAANMMNGCLISPRHIISVAHTGSQLGQQVYFVNRTNNEVTARTVLAYKRASGDSDMTVAVLNLPVPNTIAPAAFLTNYQSLLPQYTNASIDASVFIRRTPVIMFNQDIKPAIHRLVSLSDVAFGTIDIADSAWTQAVRGGDSGSPCMMVVGNRAAVVGNWTVSYGGGSAWGFASSIQAVMNELCSENSFTNETLMFLNTSGFNQY